MARDVLAIVRDGGSATVARIQDEYSEQTDKPVSGVDNRRRDVRRRLKVLAKAMLVEIDGEQVSLIDGGPPEVVTHEWE
jgi:hypothetical protein